MTIIDQQSLATATRIVAIATATAPLPLQDGPPEQAVTFLAGIGFLSAERTRTGWEFDLQVGLATADLGEAPLLRWATRALPEAGHVVGWQLADTSVAAMLAAAGTAEPEVATAFLGRLSRLTSGGSSDLAVDHGGAGAASFAEHASALDLPITPLTPGELFEAWHNGATAPVREMLKGELLALMHLALLANGPVHAAARIAFGRWLADRRAGSAAC